MGRGEQFASKVRFPSNCGLMNSHWGGIHIKFSSVASPQLHKFTLE